MLEDLHVWSALDDGLQGQVIEISKKLFAKELFMMFTGFDGMKEHEQYSNKADLIEKAIKKITRGNYGFRCDDDMANGIASRAWGTLKAIYEAEELCWHGVEEYLCHFGTILFFEKMCNRSWKFMTIKTQQESHFELVLICLWLNILIEKVYLWTENAYKRSFV